MWVYFGLTVLSTLYFGWHYISDDIAGAVIACLSVWLGGLATGQKFDRHGRVVAPHDLDLECPSTRRGRGDGEDGAPTNVSPTRAIPAIWCHPGWLPVGCAGPLRCRSPGHTGKRSGGISSPLVQIP